MKVSFRVVALAGGKLPIVQVNMTKQAYGDGSSEVLVDPDCGRTVVQQLHIANQDNVFEFEVDVTSVWDDYDYVGTSVSLVGGGDAIDFQI